MQRHLYALIIFVLTAFSSFAQHKPDTITNATITRLKSAGFNNELIKAKINNSFCNFDLSTDALILLKKGGITDEVITAMLNKDNTAQAGISVTENTSLKPDSSKIVNPGIYYCKGDPCKLSELEPSVYSQAKMGSGLLTALTYGIAKTKMKATLSGDEANFQIKENKPLFYFCFDKSSSNNFGNTQTAWFASATSPNEFLLVKFTVTKKSREVVTGSWNTYDGMTSGIDDANKIAFKYEKTSSGLYKVYTEKPLEKGQYCFMYAGGTATYGLAPLQKVYDFE